MRSRWWLMVSVVAVAFSVHPSQAMTSRGCRVACRRLIQQCLDECGTFAPHLSIDCVRGIVARCRSQGTGFCVRATTTTTTTLVSPGSAAGATLGAREKLRAASETGFSRSKCRIACNRTIDDCRTTCSPFAVRMSSRCTRRVLNRCGREGSAFCSPTTTTTLRSGTTTTVATASHSTSTTSSTSTSAPTTTEPTTTTTTALLTTTTAQSTTTTAQSTTSTAQSTTTFGPPTSTTAFPTTTTTTLM